MCIRDSETTDVYQWILGHSYEYGYILRYPHDKVALTQNDSCNTVSYTHLIRQQRRKDLHVMGLF